MPCYTMRTTTVNLEGRSVSLMAVALVSMGFTASTQNDDLKTLVFFGTNAETGTYHSGLYVDGKLEMTGDLDINAVKRAYSAVAITKAAKEHGWKVNRKDATHYTIVKR